MDQVTMSTWILQAIYIVSHFQQVSYLKMIVLGKIDDSFRCWFRYAMRAADESLTKKCRVSMFERAAVIVTWPWMDYEKHKVVSLGVVVRPTVMNLKEPLH